MRDCLKFKVPEQKRVRVIIDTDCKNEADDPYAIAHFLMTPMCEVKGLVAAHYETKAKEFGVGKTMECSYEEIHEVLKHMGLSGKYPVYRGAVYPMESEDAPRDSEGARFIIEEALKEDDRPLYVVAIGSLTNVASAMLLMPAIQERITIIWTGGMSYPKGGIDFNIKQDRNAANVVFTSHAPFWQIPADACRALNVSLMELQDRVEPYGTLGAYLFRELTELNERKGIRPDWPHGETWVLGDNATVFTLLDSLNSISYTMQPCCRIGENYEYIPQETGRKVRVYHSVDARLTMEDFYAKLKQYFPHPDRN
ncbi:MAG: nucleoside hydrolase [Clostridiales bacterium]|nr:nucleoside hydrolase [Clostridiales bacterium]